nr:hypothetical protein [Micromonospora sp. KC723]
MQHVALGAEARQELVGEEPKEVELLGRVDARRREAGRVDLGPVAVPLAPEGGAPRGVERVERARSQWRKAVAEVSQ